MSDEPYRMKVKHGQGCDKTKMHVSTSNMGRYTKKNCCCYCLKQCSKLGRHLGMVHKDKEEVKEFLALPIGNIPLSKIFCNQSKNLRLKSK